MTNAEKSTSNATSELNAQREKEGVKTDETKVVSGPNDTDPAVAPNNKHAQEPTTSSGPNKSDTQLSAGKSSPPSGTTSSDGGHAPPAVVETNSQNTPAGSTVLRNPTTLGLGDEANNIEPKLNLIRRLPVHL